MGKLKTWIESRVISWGQLDQTRKKGVRHYNGEEARYHEHDRRK